MPGALFPVDPVQVDINGVFYRYRVEKPPGSYSVSVQNESADGSGYIFRSIDDWSGGTGGTIQKYVPVPYSPLGNWGDGSIEQVGVGEVFDPLVIYNYRIDTERVQPQSQEAYDFSAISTYDPLSDRYVLNALEPTNLELIDRGEEVEVDKDEEEDEKRLETALAASENALTIASSVSQAATIRAMNASTNINSYYGKQIAGGVYRETIVLIDKNIPDNRRVLRALGQDKLHKRMVDSQWGK